MCTSCASASILRFSLWRLRTLQTEATQNKKSDTRIWEERAFLSFSFCFLDHKIFMWLHVVQYSKGIFKGNIKRWLWTIIMFDSQFTLYSMVDIYLNVCSMYSICVLKSIYYVNQLSNLLSTVNVWVQWTWPCVFCVRQSNVYRSGGDVVTVPVTDAVNTIGSEMVM